MWWCRLLLLVSVLLLQACSGGGGGGSVADSSPPPSQIRTASFIISKITGNTSEAGGKATFTVRLGSQPIADVTIPVTSSDLSEGTVDKSSLTFTNTSWNTDQIVTVTGVSDNVGDGNVTYSIFLGVTASGDNIYNHLDPDDVTVINTDDGVHPAGFDITPISGNTSESGAKATFLVRLIAQPTGDVTIPLSSSDLSEGTVDKSTLIFTNTDWNTYQTVTVTGVNDALADGNIPYTIILGIVSSADSLYNGLDPADVAVINTDVRTAGFDITPVSGHTSESGTSATFQVRLAAQPTGDVTIPVSSSDLTEGTVDKSTLIFTSVSWNTYQAITVTGVGDIQEDGNVTYKIVLGGVSSTDTLYNGLKPNDVTVTNDNVPARELTVTWDYFDTNYVTDYSVKGIKVYVAGDIGACYSEDTNVINTAKKITCYLPATIPTPVHFTLAAYDTQGYESPKSEVIEATGS